MNPKYRYFFHTCFAFVVAMIGGIYAVRLYSRFDGGWALLLSYLALTTVLSAAYLWSLRRLYSFTAPAKIQWFIVRATAVDPIASLFILAFIFAILRAGSSSNPNDSEYLMVLYFLIWFLDLVLVGRHFTDLRPFVRGQNVDVPWPHHDGKQNNPEAVFFRSPPEWLGEVISAGSSLRTGEEPPTMRDRVILAIWSGGLGCLLCVVILFATGQGPFLQLVFVLPLYAILGAIASIILLYRKRVCSYVGTLGAVQFRIDAEGDTDEWSVTFNDFQRLMTDSSHEFFNGQYLHTNETRSFENADGSVKKEFNFHWNDTEVTRASRDILPDVQAMFWQKIESVWANREDEQPEKNVKIERERP